MASSNACPWREDDSRECWIGRLKSIGGGRSPKKRLPNDSLIEMLCLTVGWPKENNMMSRRSDDREHIPRSLTIRKRDE